MLKRLALHAIRGFALFVALSYTILKVPELHYSYIRNHTENALVRVLNLEETGGGTGVHVRAPSGKTYILTNDHVCAVAKDGEVLVSRFEEPAMIRKVIERSGYTDLCLIEGIPGVSGLTIGSETEIGRIVAVIGHPLLMPTTVSRGEIIGTRTMQVIIGLLEDSLPCDQPKNSIVEVDLFFFKAQACIITVKANVSNIVILPGNSGSPLVDFYGRVIGLAFAGDDEVYWGAFITLEDIHKFLKSY